MDIFEYKKNKMDANISVYKKEADIIKRIYDNSYGDTVYLKVKIDDLDFFNSFCMRRYEFFNNPYSAKYANFNLKKTDFDDEEYNIYVGCYYDYNTSSFTFYNGAYEGANLKKVNIDNEEEINDFLYSNDEYYLEVSFYSMYLFMNKIAALSVISSIDYLYSMLSKNKNLYSNMDKIIKEIEESKLNQRKLELVKEAICSIER